MLDDLVLAGAFHGAQAQQHGVVAERACRARLLDGLRGLADHAGDHHERSLGPTVRGFGGKLQHRPVEPRLADLELRGVHADGKPAGAGIDVVPRQCALRLAVEFTRFVERQGMGRQHGAAAQDSENVGRQVGP